MDKEKLVKMLSGEQMVVPKSPCTITVAGHQYKIKQISNTIRRRISLLEKEAFVLEEEGKIGVTSMRRARFVDTKLRTLHSKTAAYFLLNNWALFVPFLFAITWRVLDMKDSEITFRINEAGMNNKGVDFFLANWQITKAQLALSTRLVGEGEELKQKRQESVENMLDEDALPKSPDNK